MKLEAAREYMSALQRLKREADRELDRVQEGKPPGPALVEAIEAQERARRKLVRAMLDDGLRVGSLPHLVPCGAAGCACGDTDGATLA